MKNFMEKKVCRLLTKCLLFFCSIFAITILLVVLKFYDVYHSNLENPKFTDGELKMYMLDVGQGDSFIFLQNDKVLVIDTGTIFNWNATNKALKELGVKKIDYMILTHPHSDHASGIFSILLTYKIDKMYIPDMSTCDFTIEDGAYYHIYNSYIQLANLVYENNLLRYVRYNGKDEDFYFEETKIDFLTPLSDTYEDFNDYSLVTKITYGEIDLLFTGDIELEIEEELLDAGYDLSADIYKAAHHGSRTSNSTQFLDAVNPKYVLISSDNGNKNNYGHPVKRFMKYLEKNNIDVYRTDELGTVKMVTDGKNIKFYSKVGNYESGTEFFEHKVKD